MTNKETIKRIKFNLFDMAVGDIIRAIRGGSLVGAFILCFCLIDYLARIYRKNTSGYYKKIISKYFDDYKKGENMAIIDKLEILEKLDKELLPFAKGEKKELTNKELSSIILKICSLIKQDINESIEKVFGNAKDMKKLIKEIKESKKKVDNI